MIESANHDNKLPQSFYLQDTLSVARKLLGKTFVKVEKDKILAGKIVETEAYKGDCDESAHSYRGITKRNEVMFEEGGLLYVYFTYGVHFCANVVTEAKGVGNAVLLRAMEPVEGIEVMSLRRFKKKVPDVKEKRNLLNGPGKICQAFGLGREFNGFDLNSPSLFILNNPDIPREQIITTTRIGIKKSIDLPWRFYIKNNEFISRK